MRKACLPWLSVLGHPNIVPVDEASPSHTSEFAVFLTRTESTGHDEIPFLEHDQPEAAKS